MVAVLLGACTYSPLGGASNPVVDAVATDATDAAIEPTDGPADSAAPDAITTATCPGYQVITGGFPLGATYRGVSTRRTWQAARQDCISGGGDLVVVDNAAEAAAIIQLAEDPGTGGIESPFIWVGLFDDTTTGVDSDFLSVRGGAAPFTPWGSSQPNGGTADCVLIADNDTHDLWDFVCNATQVYVCECLP